MKKLLLLMFCLSSLMTSCVSGNRFYKEKIPVGSFKSQNFDNQDFSFGEISITELTSDEFIELDGLNSVADLEGENSVRKYCSLSFNYFDNNNTLVEITISDLTYAVGTPSTYHGKISYSYNGEQSGGITFIARTTSVDIITTVNQFQISGNYIIKDN